MFLLIALSGIFGVEVSPESPPYPGPDGGGCSLWGECCHMERHPLYGYVWVCG